jgi:hypothetical protein
LEETKDITYRIKIAREIMATHGKSLLEDDAMSTLLSKYDKAIEDTFTIMRKLGLGDICRQCATSVKGGGCCGRGIDEWYDHYLILMNLLLGVPLPDKRFDETGCFFLGPNGCTIRASYHFCVNYLCYRITNNHTAQELQALTSISGNELYLSWLVELRLRELGV